MGAVNVTVKSARTDSPSGRPLSLASPEGISTATTRAQLKFGIDLADRVQHRTAGRAFESSAEQRVDDDGGAVHLRSHVAMHPSAAGLEHAVIRGGIARQLFRRRQQHYVERAEFTAHQ